MLALWPFWVKATNTVKPNVHPCHLQSRANAQSLATTPGSCEKELGASTTKNRNLSLMLRGWGLGSGNLSLMLRAGHGTLLATAPGCCERERRASTTKRRNLLRK